MATVYKEEVVGKRCWIKFEVTGFDDLIHYGGRIQAYKAELKQQQNGSSILQRNHYIVFEDDEDKLWFNLQNEEANGRLSWRDPLSISSNNDGDDDHAVAARPEAARSAVKVKQEENVAMPETAPSAAVKKEEEQEEEEEEDRKPSAYEDDVRESEVEEDSFDDEDYEEQQPQAPFAVAAVAVSRKRPALASPRIVVTPERSQAVRRQRTNNSNNTENDVSWLDGLETWLTEVPHGPKNKIISKPNRQSIMRQVRKLAHGQGIPYKRWPDGLYFYPNVHVNMDFDFDAMHKEAFAFEKEHGEDTGHGWLLRHPIKKLKLYQDYLRNQDSSS